MPFSLYCCICATIMAMSARPVTWQKLVPELDASDFAESLKFYTDLLGFRVLFEREGFAYLELEALQIMLQDVANDSWLTGRLEPPFGRGVNFQLELSTVAPLLQRLRAADYPLFREPTDNWYETGDVLSGQREFLLQDPDGYLLRFCEPLGERPK